MIRRQLPNQLTVLRLVLAGVFFLVLNQFRFERGHENGYILWIAMGIFIVAMLTDIADGYLARRWKVESTFGRIMDPFVDKVMVLGAFIYLAGPRFVDPQAVLGDSIVFDMIAGNMISGIYPWMVATMLARELLVTAIRSELEREGLRFGAKTSGKLKTLLQAIGIPFILGIVALDPTVPSHTWMHWVRDAFAYAMVFATVISGLPYITGAARAMKR
jgi:CDP-diacylglycerol--glycerol-3-phosphate 3-phosphatidyltransferase